MYLFFFYRRKIVPAHLSIQQEEIFKIQLKKHGNDKTKTGRYLRRIFCSIIL